MASTVNIEASTAMNHQRPYVFQLPGPAGSSKMTLTQVDIAVRERTVKGGSCCLSSFLLLLSPGFWLRVSLFTRLPKGFTHGFDFAFYPAKRMGPFSLIKIQQIFVIHAGCSIGSMETSLLVYARLFTVHN